MAEVVSYYNRNEISFLALLHEFQTNRDAHTQTLKWV